MKSAQRLFAHKSKFLTARASAQRLIKTTARPRRSANESAIWLAPLCLQRVAPITAQHRLAQKFLRLALAQDAT